MNQQMTPSTDVNANPEVQTPAADKPTDPAPPTQSVQPAAVPPDAMQLAQFIATGVEVVRQVMKPLVDGQLRAVEERSKTDLQIARLESDTKTGAHVRTHHTIRLAIAAFALVLAAAIALVAFGHGPDGKDIFHTLVTAATSLLGGVGLVRRLDDGRTPRSPTGAPPPSEDSA
jgi:hypothetical protein